jgi:hypothetical protein
MRAVRDNARNAQLSDIDRRGAAAEMAMKLFALIGAEMGDDDEDDGHGEASEP